MNISPSTYAADPGFPQLPRKSGALPAGRAKLFVMSPNDEFVDAREVAQVMLEHYVSDWEALAANEEMSDETPIENGSVEFMAKIEEQPELISTDFFNYASEKINLILGEQPCFVTSKTRGGEIETAFVSLKAIKSAIKDEFSVDQPEQIMEKIMGLKRHARSELRGGQFVSMMDMPLGRASPYLDGIDAHLRSLLSGMKPRFEMAVRIDRHSSAKIM